MRRAGAICRSWKDFKESWMTGRGWAGVDISRQGLKGERPLFSTAAGSFKRTRTPAPAPAPHPRHRDKATVAGRQVIRRKGGPIHTTTTTHTHTTLIYLHLCFNFNVHFLSPPFPPPHPAASMRHVVEASPSARCPRPCPR
jgi:hypothetical protein